MIGFWLAAAALTALALLPLLRGLLRPAPPPEGAAGFARGVYQAQMAEIERDQKRGILSDDQARAARAEVGRRLLAAAEEAGAGPAGIIVPPARKTALLITALLPVAALGTYLSLGSPNLPSVPFANRPPPQPTVPPQVLDAVAKLEKSLATNPDDAAGWTLLAQTYGVMGRITDSAEAWRQVLRLSPNDIAVKSALAETLTLAADGIVGEEGVKLFTDAVAADPNDARARFYLGMARFQAGDIRGALDRWTALVGDSPADAPWLPDVRAQIKQAAAALGLDPVAITPQPKPPSAPAPAQATVGNPGTGAPALTPDQMQAVAGLSAQDQQATINSMVDGLQAKLKDNPGDADGWQRLARAREVQGNLDAARDALRGAVKADPGRVQAWLDLSRLTAPDDADTTGSAEFLGAMTKVLELSPDNLQALYYLGQQAANEGKADRARALWGRLLKLLPADTPQRPELQRRLDALK